MTPGTLVPTNKSTDKEWIKVESKSKGKREDRAKSQGPTPVLTYLQHWFATRKSPALIENRERVMGELPSIVAKALAKSGCNIERITITCVINNTGTISFTTDENRTSSSFASYFTLVTMAVNRHLALKINPLTEFQLAPPTIDIGLDMVPFIALPVDNEKLLNTIKKQVYYACKVSITQARYLVPKPAKYCWKEDNLPNRYCTIVISVLATDVTRLGTMIRLFSHNVRVRKIVPSNSAP